MLKKLKKRYGFKVIAGGVGAWQIADMNLQDEMMIDTIVIGDGEEIAADLFKKALKGEKLPRVVKAITKDMDKVQELAARIDVEYSKTDDIFNNDKDFRYS